MAKILIVDDEKIIRERLQHLLSLDNHEAYIAEDGEHGVRAFDEKAPEVVILDMKMPGMSGTDVLKAIKSRPFEAEVIIVTGHASLDTAVETLKMGAFDFITKPINYDELEIAVKRALERHNIKKQLKEAERSLKESEERYRTLFESATDGIVIVESANRRIRYVNPALCRMLGYSDEEFRQMTILDLYPEDQRESVMSGFEAWLKGEGGFSANMCFLKKDKTIIHVDATSNRVQLEGVECVFTSIRDVSERIKAEKEKEEMQKQIVHSAKLASIGQLAAGVAHEINNPLTIIDGYVRKLATASKTDDPNIAKSIEKIESSIERIRVIVTGLRTYARVDVDTVEVIDIHKIIDNSVDLIGNIFKKSDNVIIEPVYQAAHFRVKGNVGKFQQVIMNMLSNARDAMEGRGGTIKLETQNSDRSLVLKISDTGSGIKKEVLTQIFAPFFTTKPVGKGTGLGLGICHSIITAMGGKIDVDSEIGVGTTFTITVPLAADAS